MLEAGEVKKRKNSWEVRHFLLSYWYRNDVRKSAYWTLRIRGISCRCPFFFARKNESLFREKFGFNQKKIYKYLVSKLLENRLHLYRKIDLYFSAMGSTVRQATMQDAVHDAIDALTKNGMQRMTMKSECLFNRVPRYHFFKLRIICCGQYKELTKGETLGITIIWRIRFAWFMMFLISRNIQRTTTAPRTLCQKKK